MIPFSNPPPLVPAGLDLRGLEWMPLYGDRLFTSETWLCAGPEGKCAALQLWWASWKQVPAASLADDDRVLAALAGYGVAVSAWQNVRVEALRGWVKCSDGRLYHPVVAALAIEADALRARKKKVNADTAERMRNWRASRDAKRQSETEAEATPTGDGDVTRNVTRTERVSDAIDNTGQNRTEQRGADAPPAREGARPPAKRRGQREGKEHPHFAEWYDAYPRKDAPDRAARAYVDALARGATPADLLTGLRRYEFDTRERGRFIPHPSTWLNEGRWKSVPGITLPKAGAPGPVLRESGDDAADDARAAMDRLARRQPAGPEEGRFAPPAPDYRHYRGPVLDHAE